MSHLDAVCPIVFEVSSLHSLRKQFLKFCGGKSLCLQVWCYMGKENGRGETIACSHIVL